MSAHILFFGSYPLLLRTHRLILERSGFRVTPASSLREFRTLIAGHGIDLCILCSSLNSSDRDEAVAILSLHPEKAYMMLAPGVSLACRKADPPIVNCLSGPEFLLSTVRESLAVGVLA